MKILERLTEGLRPITRLTGESLSFDCHIVVVDVSVANSAGRALILYLLKKLKHTFMSCYIHLRVGLVTIHIVQVWSSFVILECPTL